MAFSRAATPERRERERIVRSVRFRFAAPLRACAWRRLVGLELRLRIPELYVQLPKCPKGEDVMYIIVLNMFTHYFLGFIEDLTYNKYA
jgi:hypothetical protein